MLRMANKFRKINNDCGPLVGSQIERRRLREHIPGKLLRIFSLGQSKVSVNRSENCVRSSFFRERNTRMLQPAPTTDHSKKSRSLRPLLCGLIVVTVLAGALMFSFTPRSVAHAAASTACATRSAEYNIYTVPGGSVTVFWIRMTTGYCWNGSIVTYHSTTLYWGVTTTGTLTGWYTQYNPAYTFNCYVAVGSTLGCSGNREWMQEHFIHGIPPFEDCSLSITELENYKGAFYSSGSASQCSI